ncbi:unnamed protein product, partial [marine sediment metagenome]
MSIMCIITGRLCYLQIHLNTLLHEQSEKNYLRTEYIRPPRGNILDINGKLLATNQPITHLQWHGTGNYRLTDEQQQTIKQLESILEISLLEGSNNSSHIHHTERFGKTCTLAKEITFEQLSRIKEQFPSNPNISLCFDFKRHYPYKQYACH